MPTFAIQNKPKSKVSGTRLYKKPPIPTLDRVAPIESSTIRRKSSCACGGGCQACQSSLPFQAKLKIGQPNDMYEQEADRVADQVMRIPEPQIQPKPTSPFAKGSSYGEEETLRSKNKISSHEKTSGEVDGEIDILKGGGQSLHGEPRRFFENRMGVALEGVRIHTDDRTARLADKLGAMAFTVGRDIYFGKGQFNHTSLIGRYLLAHELTHVVQQTGGSSEYRQPAMETSPSVFSGIATGRTRTGASGISRNQEGGAVIQCAFPWLIAGAVATLVAAGYAWWANNCLAPIERLMYIATFGADYRTSRSGGFRRWYFDHTGQPVPSRIWDAFGHCYVACAATRRCGGTTAAIAGQGRELYREYIDAAPHDSYSQDTNNQALGRSLGNAGGDCEQASRQAALSGRLDLTAPLVSFWTPTRGKYPATPAEQRSDQTRLAREAHQRQQRELEESLRATYQNCLRIELERPGGIASFEEEAQARESCRQQTGYPQ